MVYQNYHKHTSYSNIMVRDSTATIRQYAKRAKELGHTILCSMEHGFQGRYWEVKEIADEYGLKFIFGTEAYWVKDRFAKDNTNSHICLLAKNEQGRRAINRILSEANETGYYYKPRIDLSLLLSLPPQDVLVTTACAAFWQYENIESIVMQLSSHFGNSLMLEVQYHHTEKQKEINQRIIRLHQTTGSNLIMGCDSHYIPPEAAAERNNLLQASNIQYHEEDGWFMDYPDGTTAVQRFREQGVLSDKQIHQAIENTNLLLDFADITFDRERKLPTLYPGYSQEQKNQLYRDLIWDCWDKQKVSIPEEEWAQHEKAIQYEIDCICNTGIADYFLLNYEMIQRGISYGGVITPSGRGSAVSYYTNTLLGFSKVDRVVSPITLFPDRFLSVDRIEAGSLPDIDFNVANIEPFVTAQKELLGDGHVFPMLAYTCLQGKAAFKLYAKSQQLDYETANDIARQIDQYDKAILYADEQEKDLIDIYDYVDKTYHPLVNGSAPYQGIIAGKTRHACGYLLYQGNIREEIGLIRIKTDSTGKDTLCTLMDGKIADTYGYVKNDLLKVDVVDIIHRAFQRLKQPIPTERELYALTDGDTQTWDIYQKGWTVCINQLEQERTRQKVTRYAPKNISEAAAFVAAIRPAFRSVLPKFLNRENFTYGIPSFDKLIQTKQLPQSYLLYQEMIMATLAYAGFALPETYSIIKAISKKKPDIIHPLQQRFITGFQKRLIQDDSISKEQAAETAKNVWTIIENASAYGFNASHALSVALDGLYGAYLKAHHPLIFYETVLRVYDEKGNKDKIARIKQEMQFAFQIRINPIQFGNDNRAFTGDMQTNTIHESISSVKGLSKKTAETLYALQKQTYSSFVDCLYALPATINQTQRANLIKLNYFRPFGKNQKLLSILNAFQQLSAKHQLAKSKLDSIPIPISILQSHSKETKQAYLYCDMPAVLHDYEQSLPDVSLDVQEQLKAEYQLLGYAKTRYHCDPRCVYVVAINTTYAPKIKVYHLASGVTRQYKMYRQDFYQSSTFEHPEQATVFGIGDIIRLDRLQEQPVRKRVRRTDGNGYDWVDTKETEEILRVITVIKRSE